MSESIQVLTIGTGSAYALRVTDSARLWRYHHDRYCITLTLAGQGRWRYRHRDAEVSPRGLMLMEPGEVHANTGVDSPGTFFALFVAPEQIDALLECTEPSRPHFRISSLESREATGALMRMCSAADVEEPEAQEQLLSLALSTVLSQAAEREVVMPRVSRRKLRVGATLLQASYLEQPSRTVDVREIAAELSMNYHWFVHSFRREFGLAPYQFVKTLRISQARRLMLRGPTEQTRTLGAVALHVGYADAAHMHREFQRDCGILPSALAAVLNPRWRRSR